MKTNEGNTAGRPARGRETAPGRLRTSGTDKRTAAAVEALRRAAEGLARRGNTRRAAAEFAEALSRLGEGLYYGTSFSLEDASGTLYIYQEPTVRERRDGSGKDVVFFKYKYDAVTGDGAGGTFVTLGHNRAFGLEAAKDIIAEVEARIELKRAFLEKSRRNAAARREIALAEERKILKQL